jgi:iron complex outermembrane recepter protein
VLTRKFDVRYQPTDDLNFYALASQGFRPGGSQQAPPEALSVCEAAYLANGLTPAQLSTYKSDSIWNYELGEKSTFLNRRLRINAAVFWIDWRRIQQSATLVRGRFQRQWRCGAARSRGGEIELAAVPIDNLNISLGLGFLYNNITSTTPTAFTQVGQPIQNSPPWTASLGADYSFPVTNRFRGFAHADYSYTDHSFTANIDPAQPLARQSYELVNTRVIFAQSASVVF